MPQFRCNACGHLVDGMLFKCPNPACPKPIGGGFTEVKDAPPPPSPASAPQPAPQPTPTPTPQPAPQPAPQLAPPPTQQPVPQPAPQPVPQPVPPAPKAPTPPRRSKPRPERLLWSFRLPGDRSQFGPSRCCPAVDADGRLLAALHDCLLCFAPGSSEPQWTYPAGARIGGSPAVGPDGNIRLHSADGRLHLVDPGGRPLVPPVDVGKPLGWASPLVDADNNTWICRSEGGLAKVDATGQTAHRAYYRSRHRLDCTGLIHQNTLFLGCENHYLVAISLDAPSGRNAWADSLQLGRTGCPINCPLAVSTQQEILVVSQDNTLYAFGLDGQQQWTSALDGHVLGSPVVDADDIVYIAINKNPLNQPATGALIAVHSRTRSLVWRVETEIPIESTPVVGDDGMIYFGDNQGTIHAIDNRGQTAWTAEFDSPIRSGGTIPVEQQLVFTQDDGTLIALRCSSKRLNPGPWPKLLGTVQQTGQTAR